MSCTITLFICSPEFTILRYLRVNYHCLHCCHLPAVRDVGGGPIAAVCIRLLLTAVLQQESRSCQLSHRNRAMLYRLQFTNIVTHKITGVNGGGWGMHRPQHFGRGMQCLSSPLAATNLCQSSQCHNQLSVDCHSSCMNCDTWR